MTGPSAEKEKPGRILVIDDEEVMQDVLGRLLRRRGYEVDFAVTAEQGLDLLSVGRHELVLCDIMLPGMNGIDALDAIMAGDPDQVVVMITAYASVESAINAMKKGAFDYISKPFKNEEVLMVIEKGLERRRLKQENRHLRQALTEKYSFSSIVGKSPAMRAIFEMIVQAAPSRSTILIQGESGTGKELIAKAVHMNSPRAGNAFVVVNSGSMPADLLESNLFGHEKGAFTGAVSEKKGLFEVADQGTIFLDEVGNLSMETQAKILRVIQEKEFMRLGGVKSLKVDARIIAATNSNLDKAVSEGSFREDLFYRLNVINITLPPLRDRVDDIPLLAWHFLRQYAEQNSKAVRAFTPEVMQVFEAYHWPGNVRELENTVERAVVLCQEDEVGLSLVPAHIKNPAAAVSGDVTIPVDGISMKRTVEDFERNLIRKALSLSNGVQKNAASLLQVKPTTLSEMIKRLGVKTGNNRNSRARRVHS